MNKSFIFIFFFLVLSSFTFGLVVNTPLNGTNVSGAVVLNWTSYSPNFNYSSDGSELADAGGTIADLNTFAYTIRRNMTIFGIGFRAEESMTNRDIKIWKNGVTIFTINTTTISGSNTNLSFPYPLNFSNGDELYVTVAAYNIFRSRNDPTFSNNEFFGRGLTTDNALELTPGNIIYFNSTAIVNAYNIYTLNSSGSLAFARSYVIPFNTSQSSSYSYNLSTNILNLSLGLYRFQINASTNANSNSDSNNSGYFNLTANSLLTITANGGLLTNFSVAINDTVSKLVSNLSTTSGIIYFDVIRGRAYNVTLTSPNYAVVSNYSTMLDTPTNTLPFTVLANNSVQLSFVDEITSNIINQTINIAISSNSSLVNYSTTSGFLNVSGINTGINIVTVTSANYSTRTYTVNIVDGSSQPLTIRLLNNGNSTIIGIYTKTETFQVLPNVLYTIQRQYFGGSFSTVLQGYTDVSGFATFYVDSTQNYRIILSVEGYVTKQFNQQFFSANSPYTFVLTNTGSSPYINVLDGVSYYFTPSFNTLNQSSYNFSITTYNASIPIYWTAVNAGGSIVNVSGSISGGTASLVVNLSTYNGTFPVTYSFSYWDVNTNQSLVYSIPINYYVSYNVPYDSTIVDTMTDFKNDVGSAGWTSIIAVLIIFTAIATVMQISQNMLAGVMTGFAAMIVLAFIGWISPMLVAMIVLISGFLLYMERSY